MKVVLTGAHGFLGWHLRCRLKALTDHHVVHIGRNDWGKLTESVREADAVIHVAGVNRGENDELQAGNVQLANDVAEAVDESGGHPRIVFANSIQAGNGTPYGSGKAGASDVFRAVSDRLDLTYVDAMLPNLFGEHGRPGYNSFVATFCHEIAAGREPQVSDNPVELLHVQDAAQALIDALDGPTRVVRPEGEKHGVLEVYDLLSAFATTYRTGDIPRLESSFHTRMFNTYRSAMFADRPQIALTPHYDARGSFVETVRSHGGGGQTSFSTTAPGVTRGIHFHLHKIERFVVIAGKARIRLRRLLHDEILEFDVTGTNPVAIDMPTLWAHDITNTGDEELFTLFWTDSIHDPDDPDTYPEPVEIADAKRGAAR